MPIEFSKKKDTDIFLLATEANNKTFYSRHTLSKTLKRRKKINKGVM